MRKRIIIVCVTFVFLIASFLFANKFLDNWLVGIMNTAYHPENAKDYDWATVGQKHLREKIDEKQMSLTEIKYNSLDLPKKTAFIFLNSYQTRTLRLIYSDENGKLLGLEELLLSGHEKFIDTEDYIYSFYKITENPYIYKNIKINKKTGEITTIEVPNFLEKVPLLDFYKKDGQIHALYMDTNFSTWLYIPELNQTYELSPEFGISVETDYVLKDDILYSIVGNNLVVSNLADNKFVTQKSIALPVHDANDLVNNFRYTLTSLGDNLVYISHFGDIHVFDKQNEVFNILYKSPTVSSATDNIEYLDITRPLQVKNGIFYIQYRLTPENNYIMLHYLSDQFEKILTEDFASSIELSMIENVGLDITDNGIYYLQTQNTDSTVDKNYFNKNKFVHYITIEDGEFKRTELFSTSKFIKKDKLTKTEIIEGINSFVRL